MKYVAFLRGINVSGKHKVSMAELKNMFEKMGLKEVKTYLNTGNVIFQSPDVMIENIFEEAFYKYFKFEVPFIVKHQSDLESMIESFDLTDLEKNCYITMMKHEYHGDLHEAIEKARKPDDSYKIFKDYLCVFVPTGYGKSKLTNQFIEKKGHVTCTTRNLRTMKKILALMA